ncbi:MAG: aminotransferase class I/II-fold pyridoxal phosphate-dependent enzyme [bacterium]|nr:aminotransferase class I/II-fold pyridoxal phosphate-dependent enzyme [bacterium]
MSKPLISKIVESVPPSGIRRFFDIILSMEGVISLGVGEPDFATPWTIRETGIYSLEQGYTTYTSNQGLLKLREAISNHLYHTYGLNYDPMEEILITVGVSEALDLALRAIINPGDEVIIPEPSYVSYKPCTLFSGGIPVVVPTYLKDGFKVTSSEIEKVVTDRTKVILLSYPNNPTGATMDREGLLEIAEVAKRHDLVVISDEIYGQLTYDDTYTPFPSIPNMKERTIFLDGFSKAYAMTGWRIGFACSIPEVIRAMTKIHQYTTLCASIIAQKAAIEAITKGNDRMYEMKNEYNRRRQLIVNGLREIGLPCFEPKGAFYAFPSIENTRLSSSEFAERLLLEEKVAVVPGEVFGRCGEGYIRCSYAVEQQLIEEALTRMDRFVKRYRK